jgi:ABC-type Fe3+-hydroxamate transport system substrate-binding protein
MVYTDQTKRSVNLLGAPKRIVSAVPSQTELLHYLGLSQQTVGITGFCIHPKNWRKEKAIIGGTKDLQLQKIKSLQPDLILGNKEENVKNQIESLAETIPVWLSNIETVDQALDMIEAVGEITKRKKEASKLLASIGLHRSALSQKATIPTLYFIWKDPYMVAGANTFISSMMNEAGLKNAAPSAAERYPQLTLAEIRANPAQLILLSSEPYAFTTADAHYLAQETGKKVKLVDGELFSWYGSRMVLAFKYFTRLKLELEMIF